MVQLSIIVLSFNTKKLTLACIDSILKHYKKQLEDSVFEIIVVDNNSSDDTVATINKQLITNNKKYFKIITNKENFGFAKGNNIGAKQARGKYLFFLNSDTQVEDSGLVEMVDFLDKHKNVGVCGAKLINADKTTQPSAGKFYNIIPLVLVLVGTERLGFVRFSPVDISQVDWISGGAMMVQGDLFKRLSGFDENFFMYMEDMELCYRAKKLGADTYFYPNISIVHKELGSSNRTFAILSIYKGLLYFYKKHKSSWEYIIVSGLLKAKAFVAIFLGIITQNGYLKNTYKKALALSL